MMIKKLLLNLGLILALSTPSFAMGKLGFIPSFGVRMGADFGFTQWNNSALPPRLAGGVFLDDFLVDFGFNLLTLGTNLHFSTLAQTTIELEQSPVTLQWHEFSADIMLKLSFLWILYAGVGGGMVINTPAKIIKGDTSLLPSTKSSIQPIFTWEVGGNIPFMEFLDTSFAISLHIAVRGAVNPMARKLDLQHFSSIHSVGIYIGIAIIPMIFI